jgi:hypothetical protein
VIDIEAVIETDDGTRFDRVAALVIGVLVILAALLGVVQMDLSQKAARASVLAARSAVQIFEGSAGGSMRTSFELNSQQDAITIKLNALGRALVALQTGSPNADAEQAKLEPDVAAGDRLLTIASEMGGLPGPDSPLDATARRVISDDIAGLQQTLDEHVRQVALAEDYGSRGSRAVLGLSFVALAAVLMGLTSAVGEGQAGRVALGTATLATILAIAAGVSSLL